MNVSQITEEKKHSGCFTTIQPKKQSHCNIGQDSFGPSLQFYNEYYHMPAKHKPLDHYITGHFVRKEGTLT